MVGLNSQTIYRVRDGKIGRWKVWKRKSEREISRR